MILGLLMHMVKVDREKKGMLAYEKEVTRLMTPSKSANTSDVHDLLIHDPFCACI